MPPPRYHPCNIAPQRHRRQVPPQQPREFHTVHGRRSVLLAIVIVLQCCNGTCHRILWIATHGIAGCKERPRQPRSLVDGVVLELNDEIIDAAETLPLGQRQQVVPDLGKGGGNSRSLALDIRASSDPPRHCNRHCIDCIRSPRHCSCCRHHNLLVSSCNGPFCCPRRRPTAQRGHC